MELMTVFDSNSIMTSTISDNLIKFAVVVVDPFSTGAVLAENLIKRGYEVIITY